MKIRWLDADGNEIESKYPFQSGGDPTTSDWVMQGGSRTSPENAVKAEIVIWHGANGSGCCNVEGSRLDIDNVEFVQISD